MKIFVLLLSVLVSSSLTSYGQTDIRSIDIKQEVKRVDDVMNALKLQDAKKASTVRAILLQHIEALNIVFTRRKAAMNAVTAASSNEVSKAQAKIWEDENGNLNKLQASFLGKLSATSVSIDELDKIKDLMTEGGRMNEFNNYLALLPNMNDKQKKQVMAYLTEARENAMNAETAKERVQWFIKYRGRANNFLAAAGYNLREATDNLDKLRQRKETVKPNNNS